MGLGLSASFGSLIIAGSSVLAGIVWWLETKSEALPQAKSPNNFIASLNPTCSEAALGVTILLMALLTFLIRSQLLIF